MLSQVASGSVGQMVNLPVSELYFFLSEYCDKFLDQLVGNGEMLSMNIVIK